MTCLKQTNLTIAQKVQCAAQTLARQAYGAMTALSVEFGLSRPTLYQLADTTEAVLEQHFREDSGQARTLVVDRAQLRRAVVALRVVAPNSLRAIEELLPILYPGQQLSYGTIQAWSIEAQQLAEQFNRQEDLSAIQGAAVDELFSQGDPVLAGIDLDSGYVFSLSKAAARGGEQWAEVLSQAQHQGLNLRVVVKDAAKGIAAGVSQVFPEAQQRDDCFHALYQLNKVRRRLERQAYSAIEREDEARGRLHRTRPKDRLHRFKLKHQLVWARRRAQQAISDYDTFDQATVAVQQALGWVDLSTGQLRDAQTVASIVQHHAQIIRMIEQPGCAKVASYLSNRAAGLARYADQLHTQLCALTPLYGQEPVILAAIIVQVLDDLQAKRYRTQQSQQQRLLAGAYHQLIQQLGDLTDTLLEQVQQIWQHRWRASSAIEGFNAALRPYLYVHKGVSQGFLELFRAYHNLRIRRWGRHRGTCAQQLLSGFPVEDWLAELGFPPSPILP